MWNWLRMGVGALGLGALALTGASCPPQHGRIRKRVNTVRRSNQLTPRTVFVARIAVHAVVYIPADIRMFEIGCIVASMAAGALKDRIV
jgi:hypothetical protein